ncbi:hypothetical protein LCGC14_1244950 [marine sediment metagenome]|uniref:Uncharacterized protein n=1 Tax=marine sediment metagenome TaxID=412755 RepID=A0A0F9L4S7_9ZZZZ
MPSLLDTPVPVNDFDFSEVTINDKQPVITNNLGRDTTIAELVFLSGYFGDVVEQDGIANAATGRINIDSDRIIRTEQIEATDTFTVGNTIWFVAGGAGAAGTLEDANTGTDYAAGIITAEGGTGGAQTFVEFRPFAQRLDAADVSAQVIVNTAGIATNVTDIGTNVTDIGTNVTDIGTNVTGISDNVADIVTINAEPKTIVAKITSDPSSGITVSGLVQGDEIVAVSVICTASNASGDLILEDGDGNDITDAIDCITEGLVDYMATLDDSKSTLPASGAQIISVGGTPADTRGIMIITYIPV